MLRRSFIRVLASGILFTLLAKQSRQSLAKGQYGFEHGIASGDPLADGFVIWTRVSAAEGEPIVVLWKVCGDAAMKTVLREGVVETGPITDYTVKVDVRGLPSGARLYYQFTVDGVESPVGKSRTLPSGDVEKARFAVVSCSSYPTGYFHVYREIADRDDLDAVLHLGDYIYEYGIGEYATEYAQELNRVPDPPGELMTLSDYRRRHAQYKADPDSQAMHAAHPVIAIWDDHEIANDAWHGGAENHNDDEGAWSARRDAAIKAYFEWMPIRGEACGEDTRIFRDFRYGNLLSLIMLDTRLYGRDMQPQIAQEMTQLEVEQVLNQPDRKMLGGYQESWFRSSLERAAGTTWQLVGQQVMVSTLRSPDLGPLLDLERETSVSREVLEFSVAMSKDNPPLLLDTWDGYAAARQNFLADLKAGATNAVVLSGDLHTSLAGNLLLDGEDEPVAVEYMTSSVTSPGFADYLPEKRPGAVRDATLELNSNLQYMETERRGWLCMTLTPSSCTGEWHLIDGLRSREYTSSIDRVLSVEAGKVHNGLSDS
jgi:alkaline phosphatase D